VRDNEAQIASGIFKIYDRQRSDMKANTLQTRLAGNDSVILSIEGTYDKADFLDDLLALLSLEREYSKFSNGGSWRVPWTTWAILGGIFLVLMISFVLCCVLCPRCHGHAADNRNNANGPYAYAPQHSQYPPTRYENTGV
jgi:hypothetical protein